MRRQDFDCTHMMCRMVPEVGSSQLPVFQMLMTPTAIGLVYLHLSYPICLIVVLSVLLFIKFGLVMFQIVKRIPESSAKQGEAIKSGTIIRLQHMRTRKWLHSHLHMSPISGNLEVVKLDIPHLLLTFNMCVCVYMCLCVSLLIRTCHLLKVKECEFFR